MITEKYFALGHRTFWASLAPMGEEYVRIVNSSSTRYVRPLESANSPEDRGVVNELAFRLAAEAHRLKVSPRAIDSDAAGRLHDEARALLSQLRHFGRQGPRALCERGMEEATELAVRVEQFLAASGGDNVEYCPCFPGCGWVDTCWGDVVVNSELVEVKAGERRFRSADLRQVLVYLALNFCAKTYDISSICLVNPRTGQFHRSSLEDLCTAIAGRPAADVLGSIIDHMSSPMTEFAGEGG